MKKPKNKISLESLKNLGVIAEKPVFEDKYQVLNVVHFKDLELPQGLSFSTMELPLMKDSNGKVLMSQTIAVIEVMNVLQV